MTNRNDNARQAISRRRLLAGAGGAVAAGALARRSGWASALRPSSGGGAELSQWYHGYGEAGVEDAVRRYAEAYTDAKVNVEWLAADYDSSVPAALLTDDGPDVFEYGNGPTLDMILNEQVVALDGILGDAESDFNERVIKRVSHDGHLYAVPQIIDSFFLIYRKSLLEDAGVEPPTTFDELIAAAAALTTGDMSGLFIGNDGIGPTEGVALWCAGADYLTDDGAFGFANDAVYESFGKFQELYNSGSLLQGAPADWSDPSAFIQGLTAMQLTGLWNFPLLYESDYGEDFGVIPWPALNADVGVACVPVGAYSSIVSAKSKDVDAAKAFVKWLWVDQTEYQTDFALSYGFHIPARTSLGDAAEPLESGPAAEALTVIQDHAFTQTPLLWTPAAGTAYGDARTQIIANGADPATEIAKLQEIVEAELERIAAGGPASVAESGAPVATG